ALIAVVAFIALSGAANLSSHGIEALGSVPGGLPGIALPHMDLGVMPQLLNISLAMFAVILAQSAATSRAYAARHEERLSADADLVGLGVANLFAGLTGTFVVNGSPTKTQAVDSAGGRSQLSQLVMVLIVVLVLLFLTGPLALMPQAVLGTIVFIIGVELVDVAGFRRVLAARPDEFVVAVITAAVVIAAGVEIAIILAAILSLLDHVRLGYRPRNRLLVQDVPGHWRPMPVATREHAVPGLMIYRFNHSMYYANAQRFLDEVLSLVNDEDKPLSWFCLDADAIDDVDFSAEAALMQIHKALKNKRIRLVLAGVADDVRAEMDRSGVTSAMGEDAFCDSLADVVSRYQLNGNYSQDPL
ncbi:MAG TPA: SulP family inorganic anion transporter, partial [Chloroflexota bacterium]|nr:SulP family inorganic anion transporter [Chloroflexota bacterium]